MFYGPIQGLTYIIDYTLGNGSALPFHLTNLLIHLLTCVSLFYLLKILNFERVVSFLLTVLFAVHPIFNQTIAWIPSRGDLLIGLFGVLSVITFLRYFEAVRNTGAKESGKKWLWLIAHSFAFWMTDFSKETAILFPLLFVLIHYPRDATSAAWARAEESVWFPAHPFLGLWSLSALSAPVRIFPPGPFPCPPPFPLFSHLNISGHSAGNP